MTGLLNQQYVKSYVKFSGFYKALLVMLKNLHATTINVQILAIHLIWRFGDEQENCFKTANIFVHTQSSH